MSGSGSTGLEHNLDRRERIRAVHARQARWRFDPISSRFGRRLHPLAGAVEKLAGERPELQFLLALAPGLGPRAVADALGSLPVRIVANQALGVLASGTVSVVASGTATVEAALLGAPMVVVYRLAPLTYLLGRRLVKVPHFAMANLACYPAINIPNGFAENGSPTNAVFYGRPFGEMEVIALAKAYQDAAGFHLKRPTALET